MHKSDFWTRTTSLYGSQTSAVVLCMQNIVISTRIKRLYCLQPSPVVLCMQNSDFRTRINSLCVPALVCGFWMQNSDFWKGITSLYVSQTRPVVLCMYNSVLSIRNTSLYGSQPSPVVFGGIRVTFGPEQQVSIGPRYQLPFCAWKTSWLAQE